MIGDEVGQRTDVLVLDHEQVDDVHCVAGGERDLDLGRDATTLDEQWTQRAGMRSRRIDRRAVERTDRLATLDDRSQSDQTGVVVEQVDDGEVTVAHAGEVPLDDLRRRPHVSGAAPG